MSKGKTVKSDKPVRFKVYWSSDPEPKHPKDCFGCELERMAHESLKRVLIGRNR